jgi:hypothetical protein
VSEVSHTPKRDLVAHATASPTTARPIMARSPPGKSMELKDADPEVPSFT